MAGVPTLHADWAEYGREVDVYSAGILPGVDALQAGPFIRTKSATIGIVDQIFTRVGASDDLAGGQSTFMVEMIETANILHHRDRRIRW